jgi:hypothetical protein
VPPVRRLDHGQLLDTVVSVGFPGEGVECRGCAPPSASRVHHRHRPLHPLSPFKTVTSFGGLVGVLEKYVAAHPEGAPNLFGALQQDYAQYLFAVLVFAGDANLLGTSPQWVQGLLDEVPKWAARRHTKFSGSKSETLVASHSGGRRAAPAGTPSLKVQGADTPVVASARYLGLPTRSAGVPYLPGAGYPVKVEAVSQRTGLDPQVVRGAHPGQGLDQRGLRPAVHASEATGVPASSRGPVSRRSSTPPSPVSAPNCGSWSGTRSVASGCVLRSPSTTSPSDPTSPRTSSRACPAVLNRFALVVESKKVAPFLAELGDKGRAALRLLAPSHPGDLPVWNPCDR